MKSPEKKLNLARAALCAAVAMFTTLLGQPARAAQVPANCLGNNLSYNIINQNGALNITNCTVVTFVSTISQVNDPTTCNIILSTNGLLFFCTDATGNPGGVPTLLIPPSTTLAPGFFAKFTNQCAICVNPGVHTAQVELTDGGAVVQDNPLQDDPAAILKTLSVNIFNPCIHVTKQCSGGPFLYGTPIAFVGTVTNCGDIVLTNVTVFDDHAGILVSGLTLAPGAGTTFSAQYLPTGNSCGPFTNTVTATGVAPLSIPATVNSTASAVCTVTASPCIGVTKTCPGTIPYGTTTYVVGGMVTNCGNVPLVNVAVVDDNGTPANPNDDVTILIGSIAVHGSAPYLATNTVPVGCGPFTDVVAASGSGACGGLVTCTNSCTTQVTTSPCIGITKVCPVDLLPIGTTSFIVGGTVTNCGNVPLTNVVVVDDNGTTNQADDLTISIGTLAVGGSAPWTATNTVPNGFICGPITDHVTASGKDVCSGAGVQGSANCTTTIVCPAPKICVTKGVTCAPATGIAGCDPSLAYGAVAYGIAGTNQSAFCYQIIVSNCGLEPLTNVQVLDSLLPAVAGSFPASLGVGQSVTNYYGQSYGLKNGGNSTNVNTVTALGTGQASGIVTNATASATAIVLPVSVSCNLTLYSAFDQDNATNDNHVTLPATTNNSPVEFTLTINNTGKSDLCVSLNGLPPLVDCEDDVTLLPVPATTNVPAGGSVVIDGCVLVSCPGSQFNVSVQGTASAGESVLCVYDSQGNAVKTAVSSCSGSVNCQTPVTCRVTGGGTLQPGAVDTNCIPIQTILFDAEQPASLVLDHISHGGQLGAPFSQQDCGEILGNPCIRGQWQHTRHYQGTGNPQDVIDMNFHSTNPKGVFDTLMCACLGCCGPEVDQPNGKFLGLAQKFTLCNPDDHRLCGPMPRPSPANAIIFSGIGQFTPQSTSGNGRKANARYVVFRVYIEDRSEPGGKHPKGGHDPADVYVFQAWDTGVQVSKKPDYSKVATAFRQALAADSCAFIQSISTPSQVINGVVVGGVPPGTLPSSTVGGVAADIVDEGPLYSGNQQIHPSTSATCTVLN